MEGLKFSGMHILRREYNILAPISKFQMFIIANVS